MDYITISQTIGRVIRKGNDTKTYGVISVPVYDRVGISTSRKVEAVVDTIFNQGEPAISVKNYNLVDILGCILLQRLVLLLMASR